MDQIYAPNPLLSLIPLILLIIPTAILVNILSREKGKEVVLFTILACIPLVNMFILAYIIGTPNKNLEKKIDRILEDLTRNKQ